MRLICSGFAPAVFVGLSREQCCFDKCVVSTVWNLKSGLRGGGLTMPPLDLADLLAPFLPLIPAEPEQQPEPEAGSEQGPDQGSVSELDGEIPSGEDGDQDSAAGPEAESGSQPAPESEEIAEKPSLGLEPEQQPEPEAGSEQGPDQGAPSEPVGELALAQGGEQGSAAGPEAGSGLQPAPESEVTVVQASPGLGREQQSVAFSEPQLVPATVATSATSLVSGSASAALSNPHGEIPPQTISSSSTSSVSVFTKSTIAGRRGRDVLTGGDGANRFGFRWGHSRIGAPDWITDFTFGEDKIAVLDRRGRLQRQPGHFSRAADNSTAGSLRDLAAAVFADADGRQAGKQRLGRGSAVLVRSTNRNIRGTYVLINDGNPGLNLRSDLMVRITGFRGDLPNFGRIDPGAVFG